MNRRARDDRLPGKYRSQRNTCQRGEFTPRPGFRHAGTGDFGQCWQDIHQVRWRMYKRPRLCLQTGGPVDNCRRSNPALELVLLVETERAVPNPGPARAIAPCHIRFIRLPVLTSAPAVIRTGTVVGEKNYERVIKLVARFK